jgi:hypothetical protein
MVEQVPAWKVGVGRHEEVCGGLAQTMYTHVSKWKNDKRKGEKIK